MSKRKKNGKRKYNFHKADASRKLNEMVAAASESMNIGNKTLLGLVRRYQATNYDNAPAEKLSAVEGYIKTINQDLIDMQTKLDNVARDAKAQVREYTFPENDVMTGVGILVNFENWNNEYQSNIAAPLLELVTYLDALEPVEIINE